MSGGHTKAPKDRTVAPSPADELRVLVNALERIQDCAGFFANEHGGVWSKESALKSLREIHAIAQAAIRRFP